MSNWDWFLASDYGRDRMLRDEVEGLQLQTRSAYAQTSRLSSQLSNLQGSIEVRLRALSEAFDAYVELGDIREQLTAYADSADVRRASTAAVDALSQGRTARPVDPQGLDYWLPYAVNAVIALVQGGTDAEAERRALELSSEAELFIVAAAGALGHGSTVSERVPALLVSDGNLTTHQTAVWWAVLAGVYGNCLPAVGQAWSSSLAGIDPGDCVGWAKNAANSNRARDALIWIDGVTDSGAGTTKQVKQVQRDSVVGPDFTDSTTVVGRPDGGAGAVEAEEPTLALRTVATDLVGRGMSGEADLLVRSRELRSRIEKPGAAPDRGRPKEAAAPVTVTQVVRQALGRTEPGSPEHAELLDWLRPQLAAAAPVLIDQAMDRKPAVVEVSAKGGRVDVSTQGADAARVALVRHNLTLFNAVAPAKLYVAAGCAAVAAVLALVLALTGHPGFAVLFLLAAVVAAGVGAYQWYDRRRRLAIIAADQAELDRSIAEGRQEVQKREAAREQSNADIETLGRRILARLDATAASLR